MQREIIDPVLKEIVVVLRRKHRCHTVMLYGSRARGIATSTSDYDVLGIRKNGPKTRIARKQKGAYWDIFVYSEKDLRKLDRQHLSWRDAQVIFERGAYGSNLARRIQSLVEKPFVPDPKYEIDVTKAWAGKQLERLAVGDTHGLFRRAELQVAAIEHYFQVRRKRFWGPKAGLQWLAENDPKTFRLFSKVYENPTSLSTLKSLVIRVYQV